MMNKILSLVLWVSSVLMALRSQDSHLFATYALSRYPFYMYPKPGVWVCALTGPLEDIKVVFPNYIAPEKCDRRSISLWYGRLVNWYLCDWKTTFSDPGYTGIPSIEDIISFLFGPDRIPLT